MRVILNPAAGRATRARVTAALGHRARILATEAPGHAAALAREAARAGEDVVVAAGGDGTIAEVAAGLLGTGTALGILPFGTANVLARELGIPLRAAAAGAVLRGGARAALHPGMAEAADGSSRLFVQMIGAGFDAAVVHALDAGLKRRIGRLAYAWQSALELRRAAPSLRLRLDGGAWEEAASVIVTKGRLYAGPFLVAPGASPLRPGFTVLTSTWPGRLPTLLSGGALTLSALHRLPFIRLRRCDEVELMGEAVPVQADGDAAGFLPVRVGAAPATLAVVVPEPRPLPALGEAPVAEPA